MIRNKYTASVFLAGIATILLIGGGCKYMEKEPAVPLKTVSHVDLNRYMGVWYEIARYPNSFQKGCAGSRATYALRDDGKVSVLNECYAGSLGGKLRSAKGKAWVVDKEINAELKVSFFWPFAGDYWIIDLADDYSYVVVGHPKRKYLWVLSRNKIMEDDTYAGILERLGEVHRYDTSKLIKTIQN
ncbi:MAG: hypothetical protein EPN25_09265 [Nitrospirae bacterium]|nr:MAG: hypothetical protein EPN25_09265 [Nitrospirota bacterium]